MAAASLRLLYNLTLGHSASGFVQVLLTLLFTVSGVVIGGQLGPYIQARLEPATIKVVIAVALLAVGGVMLSVQRWLITEENCLVLTRSHRLVGRSGGVCAADARTVGAAPYSSAGSPPTTTAPSVASCISGTRVTPGCSGF